MSAPAAEGMSAAFEKLQSRMDDEFLTVKSMLKRGFDGLRFNKGNQVVNNNPGKPIPVVVNNALNSRSTNVGYGNNNSQVRPEFREGRANRKRSMSRGRGRGQSTGPSRGQGDRPASKGPPTKIQGATPCPFCNLATCPSPTKCAITYDWDSRIAVHERRKLCPSFTCLKVHIGRCWKANVICSFCEGRHHLAWCRELALEMTNSNVGSEPYDPRD